MAYLEDNLIALIRGFTVSNCNSGSGKYLLYFLDVVVQTSFSSSWVV